ncbi:MAG TPA: thioredoxin family protein [Bacillota bacterium]|nr:thioredoxin family protein [Bacillota bacterium]
MEPINEDILQSDHLLLYIQTPFCGTCHFAKAILGQVETVLQKSVFYEMNASFYPELMQELKIESVPCLMIKSEGEIKEKIYTFKSAQNILQYLAIHNHSEQLFTFKS